MTTREFIRRLVKRGWLPLLAIKVALDAEEEGDVVPDPGGN